MNKIKTLNRFSKRNFKGKMALVLFLAALFLLGMVGSAFAYEYSLNITAIEGGGGEISNPYTNPIHMEGTAEGHQFCGQLTQHYVSIDWGDGHVDCCVPTNFSESDCPDSNCYCDKYFSGTWWSSPDHEYAASGEYKVTIKLYHSQSPGAESGDAIASAEIFVKCNVPPVAVDDGDLTDEDTAVTIDVLTNDYDIDGTIDPTTVAIVSGPANGSLSVDPVSGVVTYTPNPDYNGSDSLTYTVDDDEGATSNVATVTITVVGVNDPPVAVDDFYSTNEDTLLTVPATGILAILANDSDVDLDPLTSILVSDVSDGTLSLNADGSFTYDPDANFNGTDSFTYVANDSLADSNVATVTITVVGVNDPPVAVNDAYSTNEDTPLTVPADGILANDSDVDGDLLTSVLVSDVSDGTLVLNADGSFTYTPNANFNGTDSFTYVANDSLADSNVATVTIIVISVNDPALTITKSASPTTVYPGGSVTYTYIVENTGDTTLYSIEVTDDKLGLIGTIPSLAPGGTETLTKTVNIFVTTTNVATATGWDSQETQVIDDSDEVTVVVTQPPPVTGSVSGTVFADLDGDDAQDADEPGVSGVTVTLSGDASATTTTDADGYYIFPNLVSGNYVVIITVPAGFTSDNPDISVVLDPDEDEVINFPIDTPALPYTEPGSISGTVFADLDGDDIQDDDESGISGVTVTLSGDASATTTTDADGYYVFTDLLPGNYTVTITVPAGFTSTDPDVSVVLAMGVDEVAKFPLDPKALPFTGFNFVLWWLFGFGLMGTGISLLALSKQREL